MVSSPTVPKPIVLDPYRAIIFPNRIRKQRTRHGFPKLLSLASALPAIPYIRLSKIERGEVVARADEIQRIAALLGVPPRDLLVDIEDSDFDIGQWSEPFAEGKAADKAEEEFAVLLAAAVRARRARSAELTIAAIERDHGIAPVILSRIENAAKPLNRWNDATVERVCRFLEVSDGGALRREVEQQYRDGRLDDYVGVITDPAVRVQKTRACLSRLVKELEQSAVHIETPAARETGTEPLPAEPTDIVAAPRPRAPLAEARLQGVRLVPVLGAPLPDGLIAPVETGRTVEAPRAAGRRAFGLRICRPTLGAGLPGSTIVIVDPDAFPSSGGLAAVRVDGNYRLLAITFDLGGAMIGHSVNPSLEMPLDAVDPADIMAIVGAQFT